MAGKIGDGEAVIVLHLRAQREFLVQAGSIWHF
jgi:hypothetical protein